jgi:hypothetical protein
MIKIIFTTIAFTVCSWTATAQGVIHWATNIGTSDNESPTKICSDDDGNSYVAGNYNQSLIICAQTLDTVIQPTSGNLTQNLFISKFDSLGNCIWTKTGISIVPMDNSGAIGPTINDIKFYNGNIFCVGVFTDSMIFDADTLFNPSCVNYCTSSFILSLDASTGIINWSKCFEGSASYSDAYTVIPYINGVFVSGSYQNNLSVDTVILNTTNAWNYNGYLLKFNNYGTCEWGKNIGINNSSAVSDMVFDNNNNLYLVGTYADSIIFPTNTLYDNIPVWARATFFAKYDTSGNFIWAKGGMTDLSGLISGSRLSYGNNGYLYFTGTFTDSVRVGSNTFTTSSGIYSDVLVQMDQTGQFLWAKKTGNRTSNQHFPSRIATNNFGFVLFSGFTNSVVLGNDTVQSNGELDNLLTQYDFNGNIIYYKNFGGTNQEIPKDVYCSGSVTYFVGRTMSNYMIDNFSIANVLFGDILIARMKDTTKISSAFINENYQDASFQLYPNPSNGSTNVSYADRISEITIRNSWGEKIISESPNSNSFNFELTVSGLYFVTISDGKNYLTKKITIIR